MREARGPLRAAVGAAMTREHVPLAAMFVPIRFSRCRPDTER